MLKQILLATGLLLLTACASDPEQVNISTAPVKLVPKYSNTTVSLTSRDIRDANYLIAIHKIGDPAKLINNQSSLAKLAEMSLQQGWQQQGLVFDPQAEVAINLEVRVARIDVQQDAFEYMAESDLVLILSVENEGQTLTKQFSRASTLTGAFNPSIPELEAKFSQQLSLLLTDIFEDQQVNEYLTR
ncbi:MAG: putative lipoprotein [Moritella sp.]|jgi:uncharacterized lipoprotein